MRAAVPVAVVLLATFSAANKIRLTRALDHYDARNGDCFFSTEGALQFRYAEMLAAGGAVPAHDTMVQAPDGIDPRRTLCLGLENAAGRSYRVLAPLFGRPPIHVWCAFFPHVISALGVVAAYLAGAAVWSSLFAGLLAAALYAFSLATVARSIGAFGHEDFALPLFFLATALLLRIAGGHGRVRAGVAAALLLAAAIGSWHFSRFAHELLTAGILLGIVATPRAQRRPLFVALAWCVAGLVIAAAAFPVVRETWLASLHHVTSGARSGEESAYGHVRALLGDKIRFLGRKPADPSLLSPDARSLWIEDFDSPSLYLAVMLFAVPAILGAVAAVRARRQTRTADLLVLALLTGLSIVSFLLVKRLFVLTAFFLSAWAGGAVFAVRDPRGRRWRLAPTAALLAALALEAHEVWYEGRDTATSRAMRSILPAAQELTIPNWQAADVALVDWIRRHAPPNAAFVARASTSAMILTYADRPVVLHPKFEVPGVRSRCRAFDAALYGAPEDLARFCREHGARYLVTETRLALENGPDSERYVGCALRLARKSAAYVLHFTPAACADFRPLYRNPTYTVFEVVEAKTARDGVTTPATSFPDGGGPLYDVARFGGGAQAGDVFDDSFTPAVLADVQQAIALFGVGQSHLAAHQAEAARRSFERARALDPNLPGLSTSLGLAIGLEGDFAAALAPCRREMEISPDLSLAWRNLGWVQANLGHLDEARAHLRHALELDPNDVGARSMLAQVEAGRKHS